MGFSVNCRELLFSILFMFSTFVFQMGSGSGNFAKPCTLDRHPKHPRHKSKQ